jgi:hypothetical protein
LKKADEYPEDDRNSTAAEMLQRLANMVEEAFGADAGIRRHLRK